MTRSRRKHERHWTRLNRSRGRPVGLWAHESPASDQFVEIIVELSERGKPRCRQWLAPAINCFANGFSLKLERPSCDTGVPDRRACCGVELAILTGWSVEVEVAMCLLIIASTRAPRASTPPFRLQVLSLTTQHFLLFSYWDSVASDIRLTNFKSLRAIA